MRMEVTDYHAVLFNPVARAQFVHTISAGYITGAMFVLSIGAFYLLRGRHRGVAIPSMTVAASFGLASALSVVVPGDESAFTISQNQQMKIAAIEAMWRTEPAPASFTVIGIPGIDTRTTIGAIRVPWMRGLIATRSLNTEVAGSDDLVADAKQRIQSGMIAYGAMRTLHSHPDDAAARALLVMSVVTALLPPIVMAYTAWVYHVTRSPVTHADIESDSHTSYRGVRRMWYFAWVLGLSFAGDASL